MGTVTVNEERPKPAGKAGKGAALLTALNAALSSLLLPELRAMLAPLKRPFEATTKRTTTSRRTPQSMMLYTR